MGKIVKFCNSCDEGFAEKFGFCPNCGQTLQTFELNPVAAQEMSKPEIITAPVVAAPVEAESIPAEIVETAAPEPEPVEIEEPIEVEEPVEMVTAPAIEPVVQTAAPASVYTRTEPLDADRVPVSLEEEHNQYIRSGGFYVTVIEEKNVGKRNLLMLGTLGFVLVSLMTGLVINLFSKDLAVGSINDDIFNAVLVDDVPAVVEAEPEDEDDKDAGGGGGGGNNDPRPAAKGVPPAMMEKPQMAPDPNAVRLTNPTIIPQVGVKGPPRPTVDPTRNYGLLLGADNNSAGSGTGGGIGTGRGGGVGSGDGSGLGSGSGGGSGSGTGGGIGDGSGRGGIPPPPKRVGVTQALKIISKPRPAYTDSARQNNVQGTVILRVTFLASGQVGSIAAVKGLPNGLTEQAIAAARRISFEPKKVDGVGQAVTRQIEYTFSIY